MLSEVPALQPAASMILANLVQTGCLVRVGKLGKDEGHRLQCHRIGGGGVGTWKAGKGKGSGKLWQCWNHSKPVSARLLLK